ncbi:EGF-like domain-containing protein [Heterostelium album PN500]|uniref:EGF-like domain-containing protein n=1 Tax=Heterostelium pallidum (strain ATCC 26659 / Pp 5 / PN500) TaxID=670386 RepID=D3B1L7_HETP5|nr:EGF-like domain-containing protein [Heterostelium album PN500]EFA85191.1 EGF-like domain-containing protein [Heterostelium album PN500]|eukprot:XP_020437300.1 EGF-like domain-containing protein [Heterostelium album PN500]
MVAESFCFTWLSMLFSAPTMLSNEDFSNLSDKGFSGNIQVQSNVRSDLDHQLVSLQLMVRYLDNISYSFNISNQAFTLGPFSCSRAPLGVFTLLNQSETVFDSLSYKLVTVLEYDFNPENPPNLLTCTLDSVPGLSCQIVVIDVRHYFVYVTLMTTLVGPIPAKIPIDIYYVSSAMQIEVDNRFPFLQRSTTIIDHLNSYPPTAQSFTTDTPEEIVEVITVVEASDVSSIFMSIGPDGYVPYPLAWVNDTSNKYIRVSPTSRNLTFDGYEVDNQAVFIANYNITLFPRPVNEINGVLSYYNDPDFGGIIVEYQLPATSIKNYKFSLQRNPGLNLEITDIQPYIDNVQAVYTYNFSLPILSEYNGDFAVTLPNSGAYLSIPSNLPESLMTIYKVDVFIVSDAEFVARFNITSRYPIFKISVSTMYTLNAGESLVYGDLNNGIFEVVFPRIFYKNCQFDIFDSRNTKVSFTSPQAYNIDMMVVQQNFTTAKSIVNVYDIQSFRFSKSVIDFSKSSSKSINVTLYFNFTSSNVNAFDLQFNLQNTSLTFPAIYNYSSNEFQVNFFVPTEMLPGEVPYHIYESKYGLFDMQSSFIKSIVGQAANLTILHSVGDLFPPVLTNITAYPSDNVMLGGVAQTIGWYLTIEDSPNGFDYGTVDVISDMDIKPISLMFNKLNRTTGNPNLGTYLVGFYLENSTVTQTFKLTNLKLYEISLAKPNYMLVDHLSWVFGKYDIQKSILVENTIEFKTNIYLSKIIIAPIDLTPPEISLFYCTPAVDVGSPMRVVDFKLVLQDNLVGLSSTHIPYVLLTPDNADPIKYQLQPEGKTLNAFNGSFSLPFGFSTKNILVSVHGIVDLNLNSRSYTSTDLKNAGFNYFIKRNFTLNTPILESARPISTDGGSLTLFGKAFGVFRDQLSVTVNYLDQRGTKNFNVNFASGGIIQTVDIGNINASVIKVHVTSLTTNKQSQDILIYPYNYIPPPPKPTSNPSNICPGTPPCNNRGDCTPSGCQCQASWTGPSCSSQTIVIPTPTPQPDPSTGTNIADNNNNVTSMINVVEVREIDDLDQIVQTFNISQWNFTDQSKSMNNPSYLYSSQLERTTTNINVTITYYQNQTNITFGESTLNIQASSIKYSIELSKFNFTKSTNLLQVVLEATIKSNNKDSCSSTQFGSEDGSKDDVKWIKMNIDKLSLYGRFIDFGIIDDKPTKITNRIIDDEDDNESDSSQFRSIKVGITLPAYDNIALLDPDFSNLIDVETDSSISYLCKSKGGLSNGAIAGIVVGGVVFLSIVIAGSVFLHKRLKSDREDKRMSQKLRAIK